VCDKTDMNHRSEKRLPFIILTINFAFNHLIQYQVNTCNDYKLYLYLFYKRKKFELAFHYCIQVMIESWKIEKIIYSGVITCTYKLSIIIITIPT